MGSASSPSVPINPNYIRPSAPAPRLNPSPAPPPSDCAKATQPRPRKSDIPDRPKPKSPKNQEPKPEDGFDPFDSLVTSGKRSLNLVECPVFNQPFFSEEEVSQHVDHCVGNVSVENRDETVGLRKLPIGHS